VESYSPGAGIDAGGDVAVALQVGGVPTSVQVAALDAAGPAVTAFTAPSTGTAGQAVGFGAAATDVWSAVTSYAWSFGDGGTAAGPNVSHTFAQPGSYPVTLTVTDAVGNATSRTATTTVAAPVPVIGTFKLTKNKILAPARAVPKKTRLKVGLNTAATLKLVFQSKHKHLVNGEKKHLKVVLRTSLPAGLSKVTIKATVKGKLLKPDTYRLTGVAKNATGKSPRKTTKLVVVRRP
jgi:PKD repeat protein